MAARLLAALSMLFACAVPVHAESPDSTLLQSLRALSRPLAGGADLDPLLAAAARARVVMLGEASHGTHEFYAWRDRISRRLVGEAGFDFIAIEGDWASLLPLDRYVRHRPGAPASAHAALAQIQRWPRWVWANAELAALGEWLHAYNRDRAPRERVGIHGIDLYAIEESSAAVRAFYARHLPALAARVQQAYALLDRFAGRPRGYAGFVRDAGRSAWPAVVDVARDLEARYRGASPGRRAVLFDVLQHARAVAGGERYLAKLARPGVDSWNVRSRHFANTLEDLLAHYGPTSRAIVWAHNTHVGDGRATDMRRTGEATLGQLARERHGRDAVLLVGFGTARGSVLAATRWDGPRQRMPVPAPRADSLEAALLAAGEGERLLMFDRVSVAARALHRWLPHRAIGVVFEPAREPVKNYIPTQPALRYDAFVWLPVTRALDPLHAD